MVPFAANRVQIFGQGFSHQAETRRVEVMYAFFPCLERDERATAPGRKPEA